MRYKMRFTQEQAVIFFSTTAFSAPLEGFRPEDSQSPVVALRLGGLEPLPLVLATSILLQGLVQVRRGRWHLTVPWRRTPEQLATTQLAWPGPSVVAVTLTAPSPLRVGQER